MALGWPVTIGDVNTQAGTLVNNLWNDLEALNRFNNWLNDSAHNNTYLTSLGFSGGEITTLRAAISDLGSGTGLYGIAHGSLNLLVVNNFFFNAKAMTGVNYTG